MELGIAAETKKPTSVTLMLAPKDKDLLEKFQKLHAKVNSSNPYLWDWWFTYDLTLITSLIVVKYYESINWIKVFLSKNL